MATEGKVLIVDDMPVNVKILSIKLKAAGYDVLSAYNGEDAIKAARDEEPDIILLDIMMPGMDGYEVTKVLKSDPRTSIIPIVLVTALKGVDDKVTGLDAGADDFLSKPPNQAELLARVRSLVKLKKLQEEAVSLSGKVEVASPEGDEEEGEDEEKGLILIIDDDVKTSGLWSKLLKDNYNCVLATTGDEAMALFDEAVPDLILLDLLLPDMHGLDLLKRIKKNPDLKEISVIIVSSLSDLETKVKSIDLGGDDYLVKPVNSLELHARVRAAMKKSRTRKKLKDTLDKVFQLSITDTLTGLYNRQFFNNYIEKLFAASKRQSRSFAVVFVDIDHFKMINDTYGHLSGDSVLRSIAEIFEDNLRAADVTARYGGEEFVVLLSDTAAAGAAALAEKLRGDVEVYPFEDVDGRKVTVSIGVSEYLESDISFQDIIKRADDALYKAKEDGRNRVVVL